MSTEQRVRAYYKSYNQGFRDGYFSGEITGNIYERMARVFRMPIREIKVILGKTPREPHATTCIYHRSCDGPVVVRTDPLRVAMNEDHTLVPLCARHYHSRLMDS